MTPYHAPDSPPEARCAVPAANPVNRASSTAVDTGPPASLDARALAIGVLGITACILMVGLVLVSHTPPAAYAIGMNDRSGDYLIATQQLSSSQEGVAIIDSAAEQMIIYAYDINRRGLEIVARVPLDRLRRPAEPAPDGAPPRGRRRN